MTNPKPLAPPVTTPTFPCREKVASVGKTLTPALPAPTTGSDTGSCSSGGYSTVMDSSVRAYNPAAGSSSAGVVSVAFGCVLWLFLLFCRRTAATVWNPAVTGAMFRARTWTGVVDTEAETRPRIRAVGARPAAFRRTRPTGRDIFCDFFVCLWLFVVVN
jgi:hypothetical protein